MPGGSKNRMLHTLALGGLLCLSGPLAPRARAQAAPAKGFTMSQSPVIDDGDGDELLEHWGDAKYSREERIQIAGLAGLFALVGGAALRRRLTLRRACRHA